MVATKKLDVGLDVPGEPKPKVELATKEQVDGLLDAVKELTKTLGDLKVEIQTKRKAGAF